MSDGSSIAAGSAFSSSTASEAAEVFRILVSSAAAGLLLEGVDGSLSKSVDGLSLE